MIASLKYFQPVLEEVQGMKADLEYWAYLRYRLTRMENEWKRNREESLYIKLRPHLALSNCK